MKINPQSPGFHFSVPKAGDAAAVLAAGDSARGPITEQAGESIADLVTRLSIIPLVELLNKSDEQRAALVDRARERLAAGDYLTPLAAQQTADSILGLLAIDQSGPAVTDG